LKTETACGTIIAPQAVFYLGKEIDMITRETLELEPVRVPEEKMIGVIGVGPGAGVTTVCGLLERENRFRGGSVRVLDLGEKKETALPPGVPARLLVVADGREGVLPEGIWERVKAIRETGTEVGLVVNRWDPDSGGSPHQSAAQTTSPQGEAMVIYVPELDFQALTALYSFAFGS
jgi:hypothetical protein